MTKNFKQKREKRRESFGKKRTGYKSAPIQIESGLNPYNSMRRISQVCDKKVFPITMSEVLTIQWYPTNGINNGGFNGITMGVVQSGPIYSIGTGAWQTGLTWFNYANLATVFQEYRIQKFEVAILASNPSAGFSGTSVDVPEIACPNIYGVEDREDAISLSSISQACQYSSMKLQSLGGPSSYGHTPLSMTMNKPSVFVAVDNDASLIGTITASKLERSPWLSCGTNSTSSTAANIPHGYLKFYIDANNNASAAYQLSLTLRITAFFEYRGID